MSFQPIKLCINHTPSDGYSFISNTPVFSWWIEDEVKENRTYEYRICVYDGEALLWDSGFCKTEENKATYAGEKLPEGKKIKWKISLKDETGVVSDWAEATFMAVPETLDVGWITASKTPESTPIYLVRQFSCDKEVVHAVLYVCGIGYHKVWMNGQEIDDSYLQPLHSNYKEHCFFVPQDVTAFLKSGKNSIGVKLGDGWRRNHGYYLESMWQQRPIEFFGDPQLAAKLIIEYADGSSEVVESDEEWCTFFGGTVKSHLFDGETYDAAKEPNGWSLPEFDVSGLEKAVPATPAGKLLPQMMEPIKVKRKIVPIEKTMIEKGVYVFDFGVNLAGVVALRVPTNLKKGNKITLRFAEELHEDGSINVDNLRGAKVTDVYISDGNDAGNWWKPDFVYHGFRYAEISGYQTIPNEEDVVALMFYSDVDNHSFFDCGSAIVNRIQENILQTERDNIHGIATDCPQRDERLGWMNDATVRFVEMPYNFNVSRLFQKIVKDIVAEQTKEGAIPCTAPYVAGNRPTDPVCASFLVAGMESYLHYGNKTVLAENYERFKLWNSCVSNMAKDEIVDYFWYGDWAGTVDGCMGPEDPRSAITPETIIATGFYYYNYITLAKMAEILENDAEVKENLRGEEKVKKAFLKKWWNAESGIVGTGSQACQGFALWLGILPEEGRKKAAEVLNQSIVSLGYRLNAGNITTRYIMDMLADYGYIDTAWKVITREEYPSYGFMIQNGATTIWERFEQKQDGSMNSHNHPMYASIGSWFYSRIAGITPLDDGFKRFSVKPKIPTDLVQAQAKLDTVKGDIAVRWKKRYHKLIIEVEVPVNCVAEYEYKDDRKELLAGRHILCYDI